MNQFGLLVMVAVSGLVVAAGVLWMRADDQRRRDGQRRTMRLFFPAGLDADAVVAFVRSLAAMGSRPRPLAGRDSVTFETTATTDGIEHRLRLPAGQADFVIGQLRAAVPAIGVERVKHDGVTVSFAAQWRLAGSDRPLRTDQVAATAAALLAALGPLGPGQSITVQWLAVAARPLPPPPARLPQAHPVPLAPTWLPKIWGPPAKPNTSTTKEQREKAAEPPFDVVLRVGAHAEHRVDGAAALVSRVAAVLRVVERPGVRFQRRSLPIESACHRLLSASTPLVEFGCRLNARELATVIAWPVGTPQVAGLHLGRSRRLEPAPDVPTRGRVLGASDVPGAMRPVALSAADSLHHLHVVGPTGVGKSTLLGNLITGDIAAGRSVVVIDPKGDLVADVIDRIPPERTSDVILLDPTDETRPVGLNLLGKAGGSPELAVDAVMGIFHRLFASSWGPRTADLLTSGLLTLTGVPGMTLCELPLLFTHEGFRRRLVAGVTDPVLGGFWAWYEALSPAERAAVLGPVMNKLRAFLLRRRLRNVIGQAEATWSLADVLNRQQVLLVNLAKGQLGSESAALVGSLVVAMLWRAIQVRAVRLPAMVVIDEFQDVVNLPTDLGEVLAQARGFGVGLTLAHQHLGQLSPTVRHAVLANARTKVVFQTAADDAAILARQLGGSLSPTDLSGLSAHHAYVAACVGGEVRAPASIAALALPPLLGSAGAVRAASRQHFGRDRAEVEAAIAARHDPAAGDSGGIGRARRAE